MKTSIRTKLLIGFIACAAIAAVVGVIGIVALLRMSAAMDSYITQGAALRDYARQIDINMLQGRRDEKDFLMRGDATYVEALKKDVAAIIQNSESAKKSIPADDTECLDRMDEIISLAGEYEKGFLEVAAASTTLGNEESGLEGALRTKAREVEAAVEEANLVQLQADYLEVRRNEKDYQLREDASYAKTLGTNIVVFKTDLARTNMSVAGKASLVRVWDEYLDIFNKVVASHETVAERKAAYTEIVHAIEPLIVEAVTDAESEAALQHDVAETLKNSTLVLVIVTLAIAVLAAVLLGLLLSNSITRPLIRMVGVAQRMADGDLTQDVTVKSHDEVGDLAQAFNHMTGKLNTMMRQVLESSSHVASSSEEISASAQQLASGAQNQASTLEETSASIEELSASVDQVSVHAQAQAASVEESSSSAQQLQTTVEQVAKTLTAVAGAAQEAMAKAREGAESVTKVVAAINSISDGSEKISGIVGVISDIADQTNLLALNASIEAARAGEHGRGFAVVADEVSKLAERSASSTKEIGALIGESGKSVGSGVKIAEATLKSMDQIIEGSKKTSEMISALSGDIQQGLNGIREVGKAVGDISEMSQSISAATEQQSTNSKQVSKAIENVNELTQQAASAAEEMSAATSELSGLAQKLQGMVAQFRLGAEGEAMAPSRTTPSSRWRRDGVFEDGCFRAAVQRERRPFVFRSEPGARRRSGLLIPRTTGGAKMTVGRKLTGGFLIVCVLLALIGAVAVIMFTQVDRTTVAANSAAQLAGFLTEKEVDHLKWVQALDDLFLMNVPFEAELNPRNCGLGKWYYGFTASDPELQKLLAGLEAPHTRLHESGTKIKDAYAYVDSGLERRIAAARDAHQKWLLDLRNTWQAGGKPFDKPTDPRRCAFGEWFYSFTTDDPQIKAILEKIEEPHRKLHESALVILKLADAGGLITSATKQTTARTLFNTLVTPFADEVMGQFDKIAATVSETAERYLAAQAIYRNETQPSVHEVQAILGQLRARLSMNASSSAEGLAKQMAGMKNARTLILLLTALSLVLGLAVAWLLTRNITIPLRVCVDTAQRVADGDLTRHIDIERSDEVGDLAQAFNHMTGKLNTMMRQVLESSSHVASSSEEISASAQQLASGAQNQASTLEETSASIEELSASVDQVSVHAQAQAASVEESSSSAQQLQTTVEQVAKTLTAVAGAAQEAMAKAREGAESVTKVVAAINSISDGSEKISGIVGVISDIADQTNLLALNASIEAARAGEHGRGFAVVADEVSKLAERSAASTKEIGTLIGESGKNVGSGVKIAEATLKSMDQIIEGSKKTSEMILALSGDIQQGLNGIREVGKAIGDISEMSQSISAATEQQSTNSKQVSKAIENVNELTQQAASAAEEMSAATSELSGLAQKLQGMVAQFKLGAEGEAMALPHNPVKQVA